ncbi:hypothetical protein [Streptococcus equinus]|uniref:hypothetical protein n=1 Tax=Streptococcus equinus TaxID=1335 RepID=UPI0037D5195B
MNLYERILRVKILTFKLTFKFSLVVLAFMCLWIFENFPEKEYHEDSGPQLIECYDNYGGWHSDYFYDFKDNEDGTYAIDFVEDGPQTVNRDDIENIENLKKKYRDRDLNDVQPQKICYYSGSGMYSYHSDYFTDFKDNGDGTYTIDFKNDGIKILDKNNIENIECLKEVYEGNGSVYETIYGN